MICGHVASIGGSSRSLRLQNRIGTWVTVEEVVQTCVMYLRGKRSNVEFYHGLSEEWGALGVRTLLRATMSILASIVCVWQKACT